MTRDPITTRFIEAFEALHKEGKVRSARQFALSIETYAQSFNDIRKGRREATLQMVQKLIEKYDRNANYLLTGRGSLNSANCQLKEMNPTAKVKFLQAHQYSCYAQSIAHKNTEELNWVEWVLPKAMLGHSVEMAIQCNTDHLSPNVAKGDVLFSRRIPKEAWKSNLSTRSTYCLVLSEGMVMVRLEGNDANGIKITKDDRDIPKYIPFDEIQEIWSPFAKWSQKVMQEVPTLKTAKIDSLEQKIEEQTATLQRLGQMVQGLVTQNRLQEQY